ncbi:MAG: LPS assembly lipoprotein LptE [Rickettsiales bacterium]|jgi:hypothetical protein|nr:LPS assembly lipoprotein LptE [Rickettsiales bacterium]
MRKFALLLALAACGFRPLYEKTPARDVSALAAKVWIAPVKGYDGAPGVDLRNAVARGLGSGGNPKSPAFRLNMEMAEPSIYDYTLRTDGTASSYMVTVSVKYELSDSGAAAKVLSGTASHSLSYNILNDKYSTEALRAGTIKLVIENIANQVSLAVVGYLSGRK